MAVVLHLVDPGREYDNGLNWNAASSDYLKHRDGYPESHFRLMRELGIGLPGQRILDLGVGTGALAIPFAQQGAKVIGVDLAQAQLEACHHRAIELGVDIDLRMGRAEATDLPAASVDMVTASMCWGYFDKSAVVPEVLRVLAPGGRLLISSINWLTVPGTVTERTKALIAHYQPAMRRKTDGYRDAKVIPSELRSDFRLQTYHQYVTTLAFSKKSWRGQVRACKWIAPALPLEMVLAFDAEHELLLADEPELLHIQYLVRLSVFTPK